VKFVSMLALLACAIPASAQKLSVKIINRQDNETNYTYVVPASLFASSTTDVNCNGGDTYANCNGSTTVAGAMTPAREVSFQVQGATFSLLLPDGRIAVVNCKSKFAERFAGPAGNHRSCRTPIVDNIEADFHGDKAKLEWPVSLDGKKKQSETYKVLGILGKPKKGK
jgi:hypothetical protein